MRGELNNPPIRIIKPRVRLHVLFGVSVVLGGAALIGVFDPANRDRSLWGASVLFIACAAFYGARLVRPSGLEIGPGGLTMTEGGRAATIVWADVANFRVIGRGPRAEVAFDLAKIAPINPSLEALEEELEEGGTLGGGYEISASRLAALLNQARAKWLSEP